MVMINFRIAKKGDEIKAVDLFNQLMYDGKYYFTNIYPFSKKEYTTYLEDIGVDNGTIFAELHGMFIGWSNITRKPFKSQKHICSLLMGVRKEYRNMGIGTTLLEYIEKYSIQLRIEKIEAQVRKSSEFTVNFFKGANYTIEAVKPKSLKLDNIYDDELIFTKFINTL